MRATANGAGTVHFWLFHPCQNRSNKICKIFCQNVIRYSKPMSMFIRIKRLCSIFLWHTMKIHNYHHASLWHLPLAFISTGEIRNQMQQFRLKDLEPMLYYRALCVPLHLIPFEEDVNNVRYFDLFVCPKVGVRNPFWKMIGS